MKTNSLSRSRALLALASSTTILAGSASAAITPISEDFSSGAGSITGWTDIGAAATLIEHDVLSPNDGTTGDGVAMDGSLVFNSQNAVQGDEEIGFTFAGTMELDDAYTLDITIFNPNTSFQRYTVSLWNKTDNVQLATSALTSLNGSTIDGIEHQLVGLAGPSDVGDELEVRILEDHNSTARDVSVDQFTLTVGTAPDDVGPFQIVDLRLKADEYAGDYTYFDPGFTAIATRNAPSSLARIPCGFSGTSSRAGNAPAGSTEDIGLQTFDNRTTIRNLSRGVVDPDGPGGASGNQRLGIVEWTIDLSDLEAYLCGTSRELDTLDLRLVTDPSDDAKEHDIYLSYTLPADEMTLTPIDPVDDQVNYLTFWLGAHFPSLAADGDLINGTHQVIKADVTGDQDVIIDLVPIFNAGARKVTLLLDSGAFMQNRNTEIEEGSGLTFSAIKRLEGITAVSENFSGGLSSLTGWFSSGTVDTEIKHTTDVNDSDDANHDMVETDGGGDNSAGDGALHFDTVNDTVNDEQISYIFDGTMSVAESYTLDIACYNPRASFNDYVVSLWNKTDDVMLANSATGLNGGVLGCRETQITYNPQASDEGDVMEVRILENHNSTAREIAIDSFSLTIGVPPAGNVVVTDVSRVGNVLSVTVDGLTNGNTYHLGGSATLSGFTSISGTDEVATGTADVFSTTVSDPKYFIEVREGAAP